MKRQLPVKAAQENVYIRVGPSCDGDARVPELGIKGASAENIALFLRAFPLQGGDGDIHGGEVIASFRLDAQAAHFFDVSLHAPGGVVGEEQVAPTHPADILQKGDHPVKETVIQINGAVHIQQKQAFFPQSSHRVSPSHTNSMVS